MRGKIGVGLKALDIGNWTFEDEMVYAGLEPAELWRHFGELNGIPRPSGKEDRARSYVLRVAREAGAQARVDARGNTVVNVLATPGTENAPSVAIQAHLDMVCEKRPEVAHDFERDPIRPRIEGDLVFASGTTLGADNGIGAAAALACLTDPAVAHGPLELIFTVEEETGLHGAANLDPSLVRSRLLINLDSEDPRVLTIGCAGGAGTILRLPADFEPTLPGWAGCEVSVSGLKGGHSGVQIHEPLANAVKLLDRVLLAARGAGVPFAIASLRGGNAHNAIPRDAGAHLAVAEESLSVLEAVVAAERGSLTEEWSRDEPGFLLRLQEEDAPAAVFGAESRDRVLGLLRDLPHGVLAMSEAFRGKVETSSNLAQVRTNSEAGEVEIATSSRSFLDSALRETQQRIQALGRGAGARIEVRDGYGGWEPDPDSRLLAVARKVYQETFGREPLVEVIHAGLECGIVVSRLPGMEAISFGPRIAGAHTPEEHVSIPTVADTWRLLTALLSRLSE